MVLSIRNVNLLRLIHAPTELGKKITFDFSGTVQPPLTSTKGLWCAMRVSWRNDKTRTGEFVTWGGENSSDKPASIGALETTS